METASWFWVKAAEAVPAASAPETVSLVRDATPEPDKEAAAVAAVRLARGRRRAGFVQETGMSIPRFAIQRPIMMMMLSSIVILLGGISLSRLPVDLLP